MRPERPPVFTAPTEELVRTACQEFDRDNFVIEQALTELFSQYPQNNDLRRVLLKVVALNSLYSTWIPAYSGKIPDVLDVARLIHQDAQDVDASLDAGSAEIVEHPPLAHYPTTAFWRLRSSPRV